MYSSTAALMWMESTSSRAAKISSRAMRAAREPAPSRPGARLPARELEDGALGDGVGLADAHVEQEAVELGLRQRIGAFVLDRVLRRHHQEWPRQRVGRAADGDLLFAHRLQQRRLHLRRRAVDLVGQDEVVEQRAPAGS